MKESGCQKMMRIRATEERSLNHIPQPFESSASPYGSRDFDEAVKRACDTDKTLAIGLKIAKAVIVGNVSVGKTSIVNRFCHDVFDRDYKATIGVDFEVERFDMCGVPFNLQIWDTAGQERFKCIASAYYRGAHAIIVVFDLTDLGSLFNCSNWLEEALRPNKMKNPHLFLVGTKRDLVLDIVYKTIEKHAINLAQSLKAEYWAVSSKSGENIDLLFNRLAALAFNASVLRECEGHQPIKLGSEFVRVKNDDLIEIKNRSKCVCAIQ